MYLRREILIRNFNKRERMVLELIHQLTVDMRKETVNFVPAAYAVVGIHRNHLYPVFEDLISAKVLLKKDAGYQINPQVADWERKPPPGYREKGLFAIQYRNGSNTNHQSGSAPSNQFSSNSSNRLSGNKEEEKKEEKNNIESISYSRESDNALKSLLTYFQTQFLKTIGQSYQVQNGKDQMLMQRLRKQFGEPHLQSAIDLFFQLRKNEDKFLSTSGMTIGVFYSSINRLNNLLTKKEVNNNSANHQTDAATFLARIRANRTVQYNRTPAVDNNTAAELGK